MIEGEEKDKEGEVIEGEEKDKEGKVTKGEEEGKVIEGEEKDKEGEVMEKPEDEAKDGEKTDEVTTGKEGEETGKDEKPDSEMKEPEEGEVEEDSKPKEQEKDEPKLLEPPLDKPTFSIGIKDPGRPSRAQRRGRRRASHSRSPSPSDDSKKPEQPEATTPKIKPEPPCVPRQALSPAVAECQRAIFAAFLWHEGLVHDSMASASFLKFHPELTKEMRQDLLQKAKEMKHLQQQKQKEAKQEGEPDEEDDDETPTAKEVPALTLSTDPETSAKVLSLPPTLNHLVTLWDELSGKVLENASLPFPPPKVPTIAQDLQKRYEEEKERDRETKEGERQESDFPSWWRFKPFANSVTKVLLIP